MPTAEAPAGLSRRWAWPLLGLVLLAALALRLWGVRQGLPYAYNADEADHFVPHAIAMFEHGTLNPHYFANPPGFTYVLHVLFGIAYGGAGGAVRAYRLHPTEVYTLARVTAAVLGTLAVWLLYWLGARLFDRTIGLLAAAVGAVAFLPVFYAHLALNDAPTLAPATLSLLGSAGVLRSGRLRDHAVAGIGLGLACATKYTAGIVLVPYLAALLARARAERTQAAPATSSAAGGLPATPAQPAEEPPARAPKSPGRRGTPRASSTAVLLAGVVLAGLCALAAFLIANPYSLLDYTSFHSELVHQSSLSAEAQGKLGAPRDGGFVYYLWSLTWGLGWVPALAAAAGAVLLFLRDRAAGWMLVPAPLLFLAFMGTQGRYFGRWVLPIFPILCLLAAYAGVLAARALAARTGRRGEAGRSRGAAIAGPLAAGVIVIALLAQGAVHSVHSGLVLSRADTRTLTRQWMAADIPRGAKVVVEPVAPDGWAREAAGAPAGCAGTAYRWCKWPSLFTYVDADGRLDVAHHHQLGIEDYERTLAPSLIGLYESRGYCWVVTGSTESGRAVADRGAVPLAIAYYRALAAHATVAYRASPYSRGARPVPFNFDWSFDYYPLGYDRPGPVMTVYRLHGGRCAG